MELTYPIYGNHRYRQLTSPWMMSKSQGLLLARLERREQYLRIELLKLDVLMTEKKGEEERFRQALALKLPELEALKLKSSKPWLMSKEDNENLTDVQACITNLEVEIATSLPHERTIPRKGSHA